MAARSVRLRPISEVSREAGLPLEFLEPLGRTKAKVNLEALEALADRPRGKVIVVTAITPTPLGEGKTVTTIGLAQALCAQGHRAICTLRQPTLGPVFGVKGGATGGGRAQVLPPEEINFHFTGDNHAVSVAHNLLAAFVDNHLYHGNSLGLDPGRVCWRRVLEISDRALRRIRVRIGKGLERETGFDISSASELMAILALARSYEDLRERLERILVGATRGDRPVTARDLHAAGSMAVLLRDAFKPNLVQTSENTLCIMHTGPFGNIAHGNSSVVGDLLSVRLADYTVTETGFAADLGFEKFIDIKRPASGLEPDAAVLVATVRGLKVHSGRYAILAGRPLPDDLERENVDAVYEGAENLRHMIRIVRAAGVPCVVCINRFPADTERELDAVLRIARQGGAPGVVSEVYARGAEGGSELAREVRSCCEEPKRVVPLVPPEAGVEEKIRRIATTVYGARDVLFEPPAQEALERIRRWGFERLAVCMAKTPLSISHDPELKGAPRGFTLPVRAIEIAAGAGFVIPICGNVMRMPGLPARPQGERFDVDRRGRIRGMGSGDA